MTKRSMYAKQEDDECGPGPAAAKLLSIPRELIDQFVTGPMSAETVQATSIAFEKALIERGLGAELSHHLGYPPGGCPSEEVFQLASCCQRFLKPSGALASAYPDVAFAIAVLGSVGRGSDTRLLF